MYTAIISFYGPDQELNVNGNSLLTGVSPTVDGSGIRFCHPSITPNTPCFATLREMRSEEAVPVFSAGEGYADLLVMDAAAGLRDSFSVNVMICI